MTDSDVTLAEGAIIGVLERDDCPIHPATLGRAARAALGALAGAGRLRTDDSGADTPAYVGALRRMWRDSERYPQGSVQRVYYRDAIRDLANELGVDLD